MPFCFADEDAVKLWPHASSDAWEARTHIAVVLSGGVVGVEHPMEAHYQR